MGEGEYGEFLWYAHVSLDVVRPRNLGRLGLNPHLGCRLRLGFGKG